MATLTPAQRKHEISFWKRARKFKESQQHNIDIAKAAVEVGVVAFGFGYARARYGDKMKLGPIDADLAAAIVLHGAGFAMSKRKFSGDLHSLGNGALASYLAVVGSVQGTKAKEKAGQQQPPAAQSGWHAPAFAPAHSGQWQLTGAQRPWGWGMSQDQLRQASGWR
jgi:hypothetical protein